MDSSPNQLGYAATTVLPIDHEERENTELENYKIKRACEEQRLKIEPNGQQGQQDATVNSVTPSSWTAGGGTKFELNVVEKI